MTIVVGRSDIYDAIEKNDINAVIFQDPLQDEARKAKRNLIVASFIAILVASLNFRVASFLGLQPMVGTTLEPALVRGLASLVVMYSLVSFVIVVYIDYSAWKFERERVLVAPYLTLVTRVEANFNVLHEQFQNAVRRLDGLPVEPGMQGEIEFRKIITDAAGHMRSLTQEVVTMNSDIKAPLAHWNATIAATKRLSWRLRARFASLWILDIGFPLVFGAAALWKTSDGLGPLLAKLFG